MGRSVDDCRTRRYSAMFNMRYMVYRRYMKHRKYKIGSIGGIGSIGKYRRVHPIISCRFESRRWSSSTVSHNVAASPPNWSGKEMDLRPNSPPCHLAATLVCCVGGFYMQLDCVLGWVLRRKSIIWLRAPLTLVC